MTSILRLYSFILHQCENRNNQIKEENILIKEENDRIKKENLPTKKQGLKTFTTCIKLFHLLPLHTIKPHFISIDNLAFEGLYNEVFSLVAKKYGSKRASSVLPIMNDDWKDKNLKPKYWHSLFDIRKLEGKNQTFSNHIGTDGKAIDFHFKKHIEMKDSFVKELKEGLDKIEEKYRNAEKREEEEKDEMEAQTKTGENNNKNPTKRKRKKLKTQEDEESELILKFLQDKRVLGLDPGRVTIMYLAEELSDGTILSYKLTRSHYYRSSGISKSSKRTEGWMRKNKSYKNGVKDLSRNSIKSLNWENFKESLSVYNSYWYVFWNERMKMRWRTNIFDLYGGKKKVFQNFFNRIDSDNKEKKQTVIAYGSARFSSTAKGEMAVPTSRSYKECVSRYATFLVNEFRTTIVKYKDNHRLYHIRENIIDSDGRIRLSFKGDLRGLLWSSNQNTNNFVDRDLNGALNIRKLLFYGSLKPSIFTREVKFEKERFSDKKVINKEVCQRTLEKMIRKKERSRKKKSKYKSSYIIVKK